MACKDIKGVAHSLMRSDTGLFQQDKWKPLLRIQTQKQMYVQTYGTDRTGDWAAAVCDADVGTGSDILRIQPHW